METYNFVAKYNFESSYCNIVSKIQLYNDVYEYRIQSKIGCDNIRTIIEKVKLTPLTFITSFEETSSPNFTEIINILTNYLNSKFKVDISDIGTKLLDDSSWEFTPYIQIGDIQNYLYVTSDDPVNDIDIYPLINFVYVSDSEFTPMAHKNCSEPESKLINLDGVYLLNSEYESVVDEIQKIIEEWENNGYLLFEESTEFDIFAKLWNLKKIACGVYQNSEIDFQWLTNAFLDTKKGDLPKYLVTGNWIFDYTKNEVNMALIFYSFLTYYANLCSKNSSLINYIEKIKIHENLSIYAHFGTYDEATNFKPQIEYLQTQQFENYNDASSKKILIDKANNGLISLILPIKNNYWLVWKGNLNTQNSDSKIFTEDKIPNKVNISLNKKLYLSGILATNTSSGLINVSKIEYPRIPGDLEIKNGILKSDDIQLFKVGTQNKEILSKLQNMWSKGYFLSNWGVTVYLYLNIILSSNIKIPSQFLDLQYKGTFNLLPTLIS